MRKILATFGVGAAAEALQIALPRQAEYARRHGYDFIVAGPEFVDESRYGRPPSWAKVSLLLDATENPRVELVVWLDADVVPVRMDRDIADDVTGEGLNLVVQRTPEGAVPSCGVIAARNTNTTRSTLARAWGLAGPDGMNGLKSDGWWEQVGVIRALGGSPDQIPILTPPPGPCWAELPYGWNPHPCDPRGVPDDCYFFHGTATDDRLGDMRRWVAKAEENER